MLMIKIAPDQSVPGQFGTEQQRMSSIAGLPFRAGPRRPLHIHAVIIPASGPASTTGMWRKVQLLFSRVAQSFRLMVGVRDYQAYLAHMHLHHPAQQAMTEKQFHRYCVDARYGGKGGKLSKCPC